MPLPDSKPFVADEGSTVESREQSQLLTSRLVKAATVLGRVTARIHKARFGLSGSEFAVLVVLGDAEARLVTSSEIVETTAMDKTKVSRAVSSLDGRGWLLRTRATADRRFEYLELTSDGRRQFEALMPKLKLAEASILDAMSTDERAALALGLDGLDSVFLTVADDGADEMQTKRPRLDATRSA